MLRPYSGTGMVVDGANGTRLPEGTASLLVCVPEKKPGKLGTWAL